MKSLEFWRRVSKALEKGQNVFFALVADNSAHSPGTAGAKLMLSQDGHKAGTIGGGVMEFHLLERAGQEIIPNHDFKPEFHTLNHGSCGHGERSGLICAGWQSNVYCLLRPDRDRALVGRMLSLIEQSRPGFLEIDRRGLRVVPHDAGPAAGGAPDDDEWCCREPLLNCRQIAVVGGGHCSLALSRTMDQLGYDVRVFEVRPDVETLRENSFASWIHLVDDYRQAGEMIPHPELTPVVVMTPDANSDVEGLLGVLKRPFPFIGVMGSDSKIAAIRRKLLEKGVGEAALERLIAPVGLPMKSDTPEEIAVSIAAQILQTSPPGRKGSVLVGQTQSAGS